MPLDIRHQRIITDPLKAAAASNSTTDGLGIGFGHQFNFSYDLAFQHGASNFHGHGHLLRGGFARTMRGDSEYVNQHLRNSFISPFVTSKCSENTEKSLANWKKKRERSFRDRRDALLYGQMDYRVGIFTAPSYFDLGSKSFLVYPLLDERIAQFSSRLAVYDRVTERVLFGALRLLCPEITNIPLFGEIWRFDRDPAKSNFKEGYEERKPPTMNKLKEGGGEAAFLYDADRKYIRNNPSLRYRYILDSSFNSALPELLNDEVYAYLLAATRNASTPWYDQLDKNTRFNLNSFLSRLFIATTLYDLHWV